MTFIENQMLNIEMPESEIASLSPKDEPYITEAEGNIPLLDELVCIDPVTGKPGSMYGESGSNIIVLNVDHGSVEEGVVDPEGVVDLDRPPTTTYLGSPHSDRLLFLKLTDNELAQKAIHSMEAFGVLMERTRDRVVAQTISRLYGNTREDIDDIVQDVYIRVANGIKGFKGDAEFTTWLYRITSNVINTRYDRQRRAETHVGKSKSLDAIDPRERENLLKDPSDGPGQRLENIETVVHFEEVLSRLSPKSREIVEMRVLLDMSFSQIAGELGIPESTAKVRFHRAKKKLQEIMSAEDLMA